MLHSRFLSILFVTSILTTPAKAHLFADQDTAREAQKAEDYATALENLEPLADMGIARAQESLGVLYLKGRGVPQDTQKAFELLRLAANQGRARSMFELGRLYQRGGDVPKNIDKAKFWYNQAIEAKYPRAYFGMGEIYEKSGDIETAIAYYKEAIEKSYLRAGLDLGNIYLKPPYSDPETALKYFYIAQGTTRAKSLPVRINELEQELSLDIQEDAKAKSESVKAAYQKRLRPNSKFREFMSITSQYLVDENRDLSTRAEDTERSLVVDTKFGGHYHATDDITAYLELRGLWNVGQANSDDEDGSSSSNESFFELRQAWVEFDNLLGSDRTSLKVGRQRVREDRNIWWNRDIDAIGLALESDITSFKLYTGQNLSSYRTGTGEDFEEDDEDRLRIFGEAKHQYAKNHFIEGRFLYENDYSGVEDIGDLVDGNDFDDEDFDLTWVGIRAKGNFDNKNLGSFLSNFGYRGDVIGVFGEETHIDTANAGGGLRSVTATRDRDVFGWAVDASIDATFDGYLEPTLTLGYAFGSGDEDDGNGTGDNHAFRQTGLQGNTSRFPEKYASSTLRNYGEVLRPELSNLHIATAGLTFPIFNASDLSINYFSYWLDEESSQSLRSSGVNARLNGQDKHVGQAIDLNININWGKEFDWDGRLTERSASRVRIGTFKAGDAYGTAEDEYAFRAIVDYRIRF